MSDIEHATIADGHDPSVIERAGIRTVRYRPEGSAHDLIATRVMVTGAVTVTTVPQAHEQLDQLAMQLGRPDLVVAHQHRPQKRTQPGTQPTPAAIPRPPSKENRNYDH